ncbi:unnamed protein product [Schistosoma margrebowiei]|uniref:C2H2-type domain-containing protein n=1 Tax=Schistosoma margrebowiei TaxID=48269 RepID=A0AA85AK67_9TREM|nr:unnamed protein product [Schistosoma margrebowiei]
MEISMFDPCFGINFKVEEPVELDDLVIRSSHELVSKYVNVVPERCIKDECDSDKVPGVDDLVKDRAVVLIRTNQNPIRRNSAKDVKFTCDLCNKEFAFKVRLNEHNKSIHEGIKYPCDQCSKAFSSKSMLNIHVKAIHKGIKLTCKQCDRKFNCKSNLNLHVKSAHEGIFFQCDECDKKFTAKCPLNRHIQSIHRGVRFTCGQCDKNFTKQSTLNDHVKVVHEGFKFSCQFCEKSFSTKKYFRKHVKTKHESERYFQFIYIYLVFINEMEISMFDPCFGINFKVEEPVELDDLVIRSSHELVSKYVNVVPERCIKDECDSDKVPGVDDLVKDRAVVLIRTNQNPIRRNSAKAIKLSHDSRNKDLSIETTRHLHIKTVHEGINYPCGQCNRKFACKSNLTQHIQVFHNPLLAVTAYNFR